MYYLVVLYRICLISYHIRRCTELSATTGWPCNLNVCFYGFYAQREYVDDRLRCLLQFPLG